MGNNIFDFESASAVSSQKSVTDWLMQVISRNGSVELQSEVAVQEEPRFEAAAWKKEATKNGYTFLDLSAPGKIDPSAPEKIGVSAAEKVDVSAPEKNEAAPAAREVTADDLCGPPAFGPVTSANGHAKPNGGGALAAEGKAEATPAASEYAEPAVSAEFASRWEPVTEIYAKQRSAEFAAASVAAYAEPATEVMAQPEIVRAMAQPEVMQAVAPEVVAQPEVMQAAQPEVTQAVGPEVVAQPEVMQAAQPEVIQAAAPEVVAQPEVMQTAGPEVVAQPEVMQAAAPEVVAQPEVMPEAAPEVVAQAEVMPEPVAKIEPAASMAEFPAWVVTAQEPVVQAQPEPTVHAQPEPVVHAQPEPVKISAQVEAAANVAEFPAWVVTAVPTVLQPEPVKIAVEVSAQPEVVTRPEPLQMPVQMAAQAEVLTQAAVPAPLVAHPEPMQMKAQPEVLRQAAVPAPAIAHPEPLHMKAQPEVVSAGAAVAGAAATPEQNSNVARVPKRKKGKKVTVADICRDWVLQEMMENASDVGEMLGEGEEEEYEELSEGESAAAGSERQEPFFPGSPWSEQKEIAAESGESSALAELDKGHTQSAGLKTLIRMGSLVPWLARETQALEARSEKNALVTQEVRQEVAGMRTVQYEIRSTVHDHSLQLKRVEEQLTRVRETLVTEAGESAELADNVKSTTRTVQVVGVAVCALLGFVLIMVMLLFLRG